MRRLLLLLAWLPGLMTGGQEPAGSGDVSDEIQRAFARASEFYRLDFETTVRAPAVLEKIEDAMRSKTGLPGQVDRMILSCRNGDLDFRVELGGLPKLLEKPLNDQANALLLATHVGRMVQGLGHSTIRSMADLIRDEPDLDWIEDSPDVLEFEVNGIDETFMDGLSARVLRVRIDRKQGMPVLMRLSFPERHFIEAEAHFEEHAVPGRDGPVHFPARIRVEQKTRWDIIPPRFDLFFSEYRLR